MSQLPPDKIALEDLLRLKRAERPPAEFWAQFDRELHAKQLAALLEKKPWWISAIRRVARFSCLPLGAGAALALAFVTVREYSLPPVAGAARPVESPAVQPRVLIAAAASLPQSPAAQTLKARSMPSSAAVSAVAVAPVAVPAASTTPEISSTISWLADALQANGTTISSARSFVANFATVRMADPVLTAGLASVGNSRARPAADPLTQVSSPGEIRHARLLAALTDTRLSNIVEPASVARTHERIVNRLANEGLADDISRLGVEGTQVSFKF
ncbi:MAG TPA: hypothetical protein VK717_11790 [Opitutaceae bacterium]|jgi:hypothetical protein|nr:hypothetical protein [Opitutaceae bacterium]